MTGTTVSLVKLIVWDSVSILPHESVTVHVRVIERSQLVPVSEASVKEAVNTIGQLSVTLAVPNAALICSVVGLQPTAVLGETDITGASVSTIFTSRIHVSLGQLFKVETKETL